MIKDKKEAQEFCTKYGVELKKHKTIIVTSTGNIYLSDNIDPQDLGTIFYVQGGSETEKVETKEPVKETKKEVKKPSKNLKDGDESNDNI